MPKNYNIEIFNIFNTKNKILDTDSALTAAKKERYKYVVNH